MAMRMKSMKKASMKAMKKGMKKSMKKASGVRRMKKAMRVSKIARGRFAKSLVLKGRKAKTVGGLTAANLKKNKNGKVVSKKMSLRGQKNRWSIAFAKARKALNIKGFVVCGGKTKQGQELLKKTRSFYKK